MEETLSMNTLIQAIYAVRFTQQHHEHFAKSPAAAEMDDDTLGELGETMMMLAVAETELSRAYTDARPKITTQELPDYETLCAGFAFP